MIDRRSSRSIAISAIGEKPAAPSAGVGPQSLASSVYESLRCEIIAAQYSPGQKLHIQELCGHYGVALSPVREALVRLSQRGLVDHRDQRGFSIPLVEPAQVDELAKTRCWFNEIGLRESIAKGDDGWEEGLLLAHHRLAKLPLHVRRDGRPVTNPRWEDAHRIYHTQLIAACGSRWLIAYCEQLFDVADFYRHLSLESTSFPREVRIKEHDDIMRAALARDADKAVALLARHFTLSAELVREKLAGRAVTAARHAPARDVR
jgi:GntR family transcriptional regulator, carbon starvation induced regulator